MRNPFPVPHCCLCETAFPLLHCPLPILTSSRSIVASAHLASVRSAPARRRLVWPRRAATWPRGLGSRRQERQSHAQAVIMGCSLNRFAYRETGPRFAYREKSLEIRCRRLFLTARIECDQVNDFYHVPSKLSMRRSLSLDRDAPTDSPIRTHHPLACLTVVKQVSLCSIIIWRSLLSVGNYFEKGLAPCAALLIHSGRRGAMLLLVPYSLQEPSAVDIGCRDKEKHGNQGVVDEAWVGGVDMSRKERGLRIVS